LSERSVLVVAAVPAVGLMPQQLGLGAWLVVLGRSVLDAGIVVADRADIPEVETWASAHPIATVLGDRPWRVLDLETFGRDVLARVGYLGRRPLVAMDVSRVFGLFAVPDGWWRPGVGYPQHRDGFAYGLAGFGRVRCDEAGAPLAGSAGWSQDFGCPILRASTRGARSVSPEWGPARNYVTTSVDGATGAPITTVERRGIWTEDGLADRGVFVELLAAADVFDGGEHADPAQHLLAYELAPVSPHAVRADAAGAAHITELVIASHRLMLAVDAEAHAWCPGLDLAHLWSAGTLSGELFGRMGVRPPLSSCGLSDDAIDRWCRITHGGLVRSVRTVGLVPVEDRDIRHAHTVGAHAIDWWRYRTAKSLREVDATEKVAALADRFADAAATHDFRRVKRLLVRLRRFGCVRVVLRADKAPFPSLPVEVHTTGAHGRLVVHPCAGEQLEATLADYLAAVVIASARDRVRHVFELVEAIRLVPVGRADGLEPLTVLGHTVDPATDDPAVVWAQARADLKRQSGPDESRRARTMRGLENSAFGQLARFDGTPDSGAKPGPWCAPGLYASLVSVLRLVLAIVEADVVRRGGTFLAVDTDGVMLSTSPDGGEPVVMRGGRQARALSWAEADEVFAGFDVLAVDDHPSLWDTLRTDGGRPLFGRSFNPKRYALGYHDDDGQFVPVKWTEHNLGLIGPPTHPNWTADVARIHAEHDGSDILAEFGWDHDPHHRRPRLERIQLATWRAYNEGHRKVGLRPGAHILEATPLYPTRNAPRPIAADPGGIIDNPEDLDWYDAHTGDPILITTDPTDLDSVQVVSLRAAARDWGTPKDHDDLPDVIILHPDDAHAVIRRGIALLETGEHIGRGLDEARIVTHAYRILGAARYAATFGGTEDAAKKLRTRRPGAAKIGRVVGGSVQRDPHAFAQLADRVASAAPRCTYDGCTEVIGPRGRYCPAHRDVVRRTKNRDRMRRSRAHPDTTESP
jgi:hypothetical protein